MERETPKSVSLPVIKIRQPIGGFYIGVMSAQDLCAICWFDIRKIRHEKGEIDDYLGIQRVINPKRLEEIKQYVRNVDATFPTGVILAVEEVCASLTPMPAKSALIDDDKFGILTLSNYPDPDNEEDRVLFRQIARIIDGQHRVAGLEDYTGNNFEINVAIFVGADISDQAGIFSIVNLAQTKVNRSLVYDLFALSQKRSPQKTCHEIVVALDRELKSPFYQRIKRLGVATEGRFGETLSQATVVKALLKYISRNASQDQDALKRGKKLAIAGADELQSLIFRNMFIREEDAQIANIVWNYFDAVRERWPKAWAATGTGYVLNRTNGFNALMRFLRPAYRNFMTTDSNVPTEQFLSLLKKVNIPDDGFTTDRYKPGTSGETTLYNDFMQSARLSGDD
jgi:DGQHR domain-containing protein